MNDTQHKFHESHTSPDNSQDQPMKALLTKDVDYNNPNKIKLMQKIRSYFIV